MQEYVAGFLFDSKRTEVALICKARPKWQAGKWNGIGGHVEPEESPFDAMKREFREETSHHRTDWEHFVSLEYPEAIVHFYRAFDENPWRHLVTMTDEPVGVWPLNDLPKNVIPNLCWLLPLALSMDSDVANLFHMKAVD